VRCIAWSLRRGHFGLLLAAHQHSWARHNFPQLKVAPSQLARSNSG
jgi:hypothetical protein